MTEERAWTIKEKKNKIKIWSNWKTTFPDLWGTWYPCEGSWNQDIWHWRVANCGMREFHILVELVPLFLHFFSSPSTIQYFQLVFSFFFPLGLYAHQEPPPWLANKYIGEIHFSSLFKKKKKKKQMITRRSIFCGGTCDPSPDDTVFIGSNASLCLWAITSGRIRIRLAGSEKKRRRKRKKFLLNKIK